MASIDDCKMVELKKVGSDKGSLTFIENEESAPFDVKRVYFTYDIPTEAVRGGHAHIEQHELVFAASGSFEIVLDDGNKAKTVFLNNPRKGLHIIPGIWRELKSFSTGSVVLVMASDAYDEDDYIMDYNQFIHDRSN
ncbi:sugar 3,4-ketoisomerase [Plebeiibacterium marinum]|uniref:FdtA/QdtA family cupin domain-containing protein n=1 Tax=Plebeiibacterium marinum TaxID=2992111 RepID=A0AAE3MGG6_9BACT|nr:FdtA/QdtA family cupin domain-containing protein [Plebeiobacterium marinum]MCW3807388.1 FdtA/QdtA family cupin domain-containing protein [Plebeiobacterium marinum]